MILAIDPGPHTGIVRWYQSWPVPPGSPFQTQTLDFTREPDTAYISLYDFLQDNTHHGDTIVLERFEFQKEKAQQRGHLNFTAAEHVGAVKLWHQLKGEGRGVKLVIQSPSVAVGNEATKDDEHGIFWTREKLEKLGLWQMCKTNHERSAMRHLLYYVSFTLRDNRFLLALK